MNAASWIIAIGIIALFSAALVFIDPLTLIADWWDWRKWNRSKK